MTKASASGTKVVISAARTDLSDLDAAAVDRFVDDLYSAALDLVEALGDDG